MAATAHLTLVAPDTEKFTVQSVPARLLKSGLTAPVASFEATVGGSSCPRLAEFFKKISMNARWVPFCVEVPAA